MVSFIIIKIINFIFSVVIIAISGGFSGKCFLNTIEYLDLNTNEWTTFVNVDGPSLISQNKHTNGMQQLEAQLSKLLLKSESVCGDLFDTNGCHQNGGANDDKSPRSQSEFEFESKSLHQQCDKNGVANENGVADKNGDDGAHHHQAHDELTTANFS